MNSPNLKDLKTTLKPVKSRDMAEIIHDIGESSIELVKTESQLLRVEIMQELTGEIMFTRRLIIASAMLVVGVSMLFFCLALVLHHVLHPWVTALIIGLVLTGGGFTVAIVAWKQHKTLGQIKAELEPEIASLFDFSPAVK